MSLLPMKSTYRQTSASISVVFGCDPRQQCMRYGRTRSRDALEVIITERVSAALRQSGIANRVITNDYPLGIITIENVLQVASLSFRPATVWYIAISVLAL